ncbi:MAG: DMT family transporter [Acetobacteraceae bacterium]
MPRITHGRIPVSLSRIALAFSERGRGEGAGLALLLITVICWGLNWPALKLVLFRLPPFSMRSVTALAAAIAVMAVAAMRGERLAPPHGQWPRLLAASFLNYTSWFGFVTVALVWLPASTAVIITYTMPVWAICFAWPILGERPTGRHIGGLCLGIGGVVTVLGGGATPIATNEWVGVGCALAAAVLFALGSVSTKRWPVALPPFAMMGWQMLLGVAPICVLALALEHPDFSDLPVIDIAALGYTTFVALLFGYLCWFRALKLLPASVATGGTLLVPVIGVFGSGLLLGETLGVRQFVALALTVSGVALAVRR